MSSMSVVLMVNMRMVANFEENEKKIGCGEHADWHQRVKT